MRPGETVMGGVPVGMKVYSRGIKIPEESMGRGKGTPTEAMANLEVRVRFPA